MTEDEVRKFWKSVGKDIFRDFDGYFVYWPNTLVGSHNAYSLRIIAELLDLANYTWDQEVKEYFDA